MLPKVMTNPQAIFVQRWFTYLIYIPLLVASTVLFGCLSLVCGLWDRSGRQQHRIARLWGKSLLWLGLSPVRVDGAEKLRAAPAVYACNHLSYMDTPTLFGQLPFQFRIFAKAGLWKLPFIGWYLDRSGQVPIDDKSPRSAIAGLLRGVKTLHSGLPVLIFPEGRRTPDGTIKTMASGAAFLAIRAQVPLVPLALVGTYELLPLHTYHIAPRPIRLLVGDAIATTGKSTGDAEELTSTLFKAISDLYARHG